MEDLPREPALDEASSHNTLGDPIRRPELRKHPDVTPKHPQCSTARPPARARARAAARTPFLRKGGIYRAQRPGR